MTELKLRKDNNGITLIELIIAMAISGIVFSILILVINVALKGFDYTNDDVNLQIEAQTAMNQISTLAMEAYRIKGPDETSPDRYLICGKDTDSPCNAIVLDSVADKLYLVQSASEADAKIAPYKDESNLLAEYVDEIMINQESGSSREVDIIIRFAAGEGENAATYSISRRVILRNAEKIK